MSNFRMTTRYIVSTQTISIIFKIFSHNHESHGKIQSCIIVIMFVFFRALLMYCCVGAMYHCYDFVAFLLESKVT